jgi:hypothetical protein
MASKGRKKGGVMRSGVSPDVGKATQFKIGHKSVPGPGRPKTKILREIAREIVEEVNPKKKKIRARILLEKLISQAEKGSLGHFQQVLQLLEADASGANWPGANSAGDGSASVKDFSKAELTAILRARTAK